MIKAFDLRPFNLVYRDGEVYEFNPADYCATDEMGKLYFLNTVSFEPIPLTEEWLAKLGYFHVNTTSDGGQLWQCGNLELLITAGRIHVSEGAMCIIGRPLEYVHSLQNAHHALTGYELQIKDI